MPTFDDPVTDAEEAQRALRGLAHATRSIDDPTTVYTILGSLSAAVASLEQALHQVAVAHDGPNAGRAKGRGDARDARAAASRVSMDLHRAAEMLHQVRAGIDRAHQVEATIAYDTPATPTPVTDRRTAPPPGMSL